MTKEAKIFVLGLELSRSAGGMEWHGSVPPEIIELYQLASDFKHGTIAGVYVTISKQYTAYTPEWLEKK